MRPSLWPNGKPSFGNDTLARPSASFPKRIPHRVSPHRWSNLTASFETISCCIWRSKLRSPRSRFSLMFSELAQLAHFLYAHRSVLLLPCVERGLTDAKLMAYARHIRSTLILLQRVSGTARRQPGPGTLGTTKLIWHKPG
jgi:hypothetical protein